MKDGWQIAELGAVAKLRGGGTPSKDNPKYWGGNIPWVSPKDMKNSLIGGAADRITLEAVRNSATSIIPSGSILVVVRSGILARTVPIGRTIRDVAINQDIKAICPTSAIDRHFLHYFLLASEDLLLKSVTRGATVHRLSSDDLANLRVPFPPLPEQKRIVAILDEAFAGIATAIANAEKNRANARELFESHLDAVFTQRGEGWRETNLGAEVDLLAGFAFKSKQYSQSVDDIRLLRGDNIIHGRLRWNDVKRWPASDMGDYGRYQLSVGDVIIAMDRTWIKSGIKYAEIGPADLPCLLVQRVARLRPKSTLFQRFLLHLIGSAQFRKYVVSIQTGTGVPHISGKQIADFAFWRPPVHEQWAISGRLDQLSSDVHRLESVCMTKISALTELKQSLLRKAFAGELTETAVAEAAA